MDIALLALGFAAGAGVVELVRRSPIVDNGFSIFAAPDEKSRDALVEILAIFGLKPRYRIDSTWIKRALLADRRTIINATNRELWQQMGCPAAGLAIVVRNPQDAARRAVAALKGRGFEAEVLGELDKDVPAGSMVFVRTNALASTVLVFRKHLLLMGPPPPRWE